MNRLYKKSKLWFALVWIIVYVIGTSAADEFSKTLGLEKSLTLPFLLLLTASSLLWLGRNGLFRQFGLCRPSRGAKQMLYYIPLMILASCNLWYGVTLNYGVAETVLYMLCMLLVGFLEELIFRGFLFDAMRKDSLKAAIIVSSVTFGIGHIVNLFNGSGAELLANICQVCYAIAAGFVFVIIYYKTESLLPCIATHSVLNALSAFAKPQSAAQQIVTSVILCVIPLVYALYLLRLQGECANQEE